MVTSDVCARLLKQRLVVPKTAPLVETNRAQAFRESVRDENLYPAHRSSSALGVGKDKFKAHGAPIFTYLFIYFGLQINNSSFKKHYHTYVRGLFIVHHMHALNQQNRGAELLMYNS